MSDIRDLLDIINEDNIEVNDSFDLEIGEDLLIETGVVAVSEDSDIIVEGDDDMIRLLSEAGMVEEEELDEGDIIKGRFPPKQGSLFTEPAAGKPAGVSMIPSIDTAKLYQEFIQKVNPKLINTEDDFLTYAFNFLRGKNFGPVKPIVLYKMAEKMKQVHDSKTQAGGMYEGENELAEVAKLAGLNWNDPNVRAHFDKPTSARIASGETEPVDRTDYDTPPAMRDPMQGKPGFEKRRGSLIKQGILKAGVEEDLGYNPYESINEGPADEPEHEDTDADDKRWDDKEEKVDEADEKGLAPDQRPGYHDQYDDQATYKYALQIADAIKKDTGATVDINTGRMAGDQRGTYQIVINPQPNNRLKGFLPDGDRGATPQNVTKAIAQWFRMFRSKNWRFDQPVQGQFVIGVPNGVQHDKLDEVEMDEAKYQGREVPLGKPMAGDVKKSKVYVRKPNGKIVKVNFGDKKMKIKKSNPKRRKSFRARHNCKNPGPRWKARYWSCRAW